MRAGKLRHQITIEQVAETQNDFGEILSSWSTFASPRAAIKWLGAGESNGDQVNASNRVEFTIRYQTGITQKMRVVYDGRTFDIHGAPVVDELKRMIVITATEYVS